MFRLSGAMPPYLVLSFVLAITLNSLPGTSSTPAEERVARSQKAGRSSCGRRKLTPPDTVSEPMPTDRQSTTQEPRRQIDHLIVTPYLDSLSTSRIHDLLSVPPLIQDVRSYAGFFTVNETHNSNLFFWFFKSDSDYANRPLVLWLQGGPGDPFVNSLFFGNGPYLFSGKSEVRPSPTSWTTKVNLLYIDSPVGAGFSYTDSSNGYCKTVGGAAANVYQALLQFFQIFPELRRNKLYLAGESYAGKFLPTLSSIILGGNAGTGVVMNLAGVSIGCGFIDPVNQMYFADFYYQVGLIDRKTRNDVLVLEEKLRAHIKRGNIYSALALSSYLLSKAYFLDLYPDLDARGRTDLKIELFDQLHEFMDSKKMRKWLHVGSRPFQNKVKVVWHFKGDFLSSVGGHVEELLRHRKLLLYAGQFDALIPPYQIDKVIQALSWSNKEEFYKANRSKWYLAGELAGFKKSAGNLMQVLVRGSGHFILRTQPMRVRDMFFAFADL